MEEDYNPKQQTSKKEELEAKLLKAKAERDQRVKEEKSYGMELAKYGKMSPMYLENINTFFDKKGVMFVPKVNYMQIYEAKDKSYVSRFALKGVDLFKELPINEPVKFDIKKMQTAINHGMIMLINYKGAEDDVLSGHERVIYPIVLGKSSKGKLLLRGFHLKGWSVSNNRNTEKIWRMFRPDRILSMTFTGSFFRLPPAGYNMYDKGMRGGIIVAADFNRLRRNQKKLIDAQKIQNRDDANVSKVGLTKIKLTDTNTTLDVKDPFKNKYLNVKELDFLTITFMKSILGGDQIAILGLTSDKPNLTVKAFDEKKKPIGTYKTVSTFSGKQLKMFKAKNVKGQQEFDLYIFNEKFK
jgi:hypothetical protein